MLPLFRSTAPPCFARKLLLDTTQGSTKYWSIIAGVNLRHGYKNVLRTGLPISTR